MKKQFFPHSLIFIDPDNGLEVKQSDERHLLYQEVKDLYGHMDKNSILMIYQHFPRKNHPKYLFKRVKELSKFAEKPIYISDNEIIFFLLAKTDKLKNQLRKVINRYQKNYPNLFNYRN